MSVQFEINEYKLINVIGKGSFGVLIKVLNQLDNNYYAIKIISKDKKNLNVENELINKYFNDKCKLQLSEFTIDQLNDINNANTKTKESLNEVLNHLKCHTHPNIVSIHSILDSDNLIFIIMDYHPNDLYNAITNQNIFKKNGALIKKVFIQLCSAIFHCHENNIYHCDIKPENMLLDDNFNLYLCDFGLSITENFLSIDSKIGSSYYMSPERLNFFKDSNIKIVPTYKGDIWSLGITLINLTCNKCPWLSADKFNDKNFIYYYKNSSLLKEILPISNIFNSLLLKILNINPYYRIDIPEIIDEIITIKSFLSYGPLSIVSTLDIDTCISILYCNDDNNTNNAQKKKKNSSISSSTSSCSSSISSTFSFSNSSTPTSYTTDDYYDDEDNNNTDHMTLNNKTNTNNNNNNINIYNYMNFDSFKNDPTIDLSNLNIEYSNHFKDFSIDYSVNDNTTLNDNINDNDINLDNNKDINFNNFIFDLNDDSNKIKDSILCYDDNDDNDNNGDISNTTTTPNNNDINDTKNGLSPTDSIPYNKNFLI